MVSSGQARRTFRIVVAATKQMGIGKGGTLPWHLPGDMKYFKELTSRTSDPSKKNAVIMGRKTWESIHAKFRPLPGRVNVVLSRENSQSASDVASDSVANNAAAPPSASITGENVHVADSLDAALSLLSSPEVDPLVENVFVIGGGQIYKESMVSPHLSAVHLTLVETDVQCDTFIQPIDDVKFKLWAAGAPRRDSPKGPWYSFLCYTRSADNNSTHF